MGHELVTQSGPFYAVCTTPDMCKVQAGAAIAIVPFMIKCEFKEAEDVSPDVEAAGHPVVYRKASRVPSVTGDMGGNQFGVKSQTKEAEVRSVTGTTITEFNGKEGARQSDLVTMNKGNTFGKIFWRGSPKLPTVGSKPPAPEPDSPEGEADSFLDKAMEAGGSDMPAMPKGALEGTLGKPKQPKEKA